MPRLDVGLYVELLWRSLESYYGRVVRVSFKEDAIDGRVVLSRRVLLCKLNYLPSGPQMGLQRIFRIT